MKYIIKDANKKEILLTEDLNEAYETLKKKVPSRHMISFEQLQESIKRDREWGKEPIPYGFYINKRDAKLIYMDIYYNL